MITLECNCPHCGEYIAVDVYPTPPTVTLDCPCCAETFEYDLHRSEVVEGSFKGEAM